MSVQIEVAHLLALRGLWVSSVGTVIHKSIPLRQGSHRQSIMTRPQHVALSGI